MGGKNNTVGEKNNTVGEKINTLGEKSIKGENMIAMKEKSNTMVKKY